MEETGTNSEIVPLKNSNIEATTPEDAGPCAACAAEESCGQDQRGQTEVSSGVEALVQALVFASGEPVTINQLATAASLEESEIEAALSVIEERLAGEAFGFELVRVAGKCQFRTKPIFSSYLRELKADRPRRLSSAALETLSVVAYRQPVVKSDIEKIRGVDVTPTLKTLLERNLVRIIGHQSTVGQPALYGTTEEFLKLFGLNSLAELPTLRDLAELEKDPGEVPSEEVPALESSQESGQDVSVSP